MPVADSAAPNSKSSQFWALATLGAPTSVSTTTAAYPARENIVSLLGGAQTSGPKLPPSRGGPLVASIQPILVKRPSLRTRSSLEPAYFYLVPGSRWCAG